LTAPDRLCANATVPEPKEQAVPPAGVTIVRDQEYATVGGASLRADLFLPDAARTPVPAIVWIHGGGWRFGNRRLGPGLSRFFAARGFAMVAIDYRLTRRATFPAQIQDVKTAIRWLRSVSPAYGIDGSRIGLWGASSGAHLAALAALAPGRSFTAADAPYPDQSSAVQAVVDGYGPIDFLQMDAHRPPAGSRCADAESLLLPRADMRSADADSFESLLLGAPVDTRPDLAREASPLTYVRAQAPPFLIVHGACDTTIAPHQSQLLFDALADAGNDVTFALAGGLGHGFFDRPHLDDRGPTNLLVRRAADGIVEPPLEMASPVFDLVEAFFIRSLVPA
jgi:acetyl esterase/lipase